MEPVDPRQGNAKTDADQKGASPEFDATTLLREGVAHQQAGRLADAADKYEAVLKAQPRNHFALNFLGVVASQRGDHERAAALMEKAVAAAPDYADAYANMITPLFELGRLREARRAAERTLQRAPNHAGALVKLGALERKCDNLQEAAKAFEKALRLDPNQAHGHLNYGHLLSDVGEFDGAEMHYKKVIALAPNLTQAHRCLSKNALSRGDVDGAAGHLRNAIAINPRDMDAHYNLIELYERANRDADMRAAIDAARKAAPGDPNFLVMQARALANGGDDNGAVRRLEEIPAGAPLTMVANVARALLVAEILERKGEYAAAFEHYAEANRIVAGSSSATGVKPERYASRLAALQGRFTPEWTRTWRKAAPGDDRASPAFLVGFPRSGTTLLENFLRGHDAFEVLEEKSMANRAVIALDALPGGDPDALAALSQEGLAALRKAYFDELDKHAAPDSRSKAIIDKQPLNMARAGVLHRLFPDAKFIFMERDPRDCVFSAFARQFGLDNETVHFLDLTGTAEIYDKVMTLWTDYCESLPLSVHNVRYERLIEDPEGVLRPLMAFLGQDWRPDVLDHVATVRNRDLVTSASYRQVAQPLYASSSGRWRRFADQLQPVRPILDNWARKLGYAT